VSKIKKKKLNSGMQANPVCNSLDNYAAPLTRSEEWRLKRLMIMRRHERHTNFGGIPNEIL
jgi:hypothetical protein